MRSSVLLLALPFFLVACGDGDANKGAGDSASNVAKKPVKPKIDPEEEARKQVEAERLAAEAAAAKKARKKQIAELQAKLDELKKANEEDAKKLPDRAKLRRRLSGMIRDSARAKSLYETDQRRFDELQKVVQGSATAELKALQEKLKAAEKAYYATLSGVREERAQKALGIVEETQIQKEIRALREAKEQWFAATRETRRGGAAAAVRSQAASAFKTWIQGDPLRKSVIAQALPDGTSPDAYDFSDLDFYLLMEILEDALDRKNFAEEKKEISQNDKKLIEMEKAMDALNEQIAEKMMAGGDEMEEFTELSEALPAKKRKAESLERGLSQMREVYNEIEETLERHENEEAAIETEIEKLKRP